MQGNFFFRTLLIFLVSQVCFGANVNKHSGVRFPINGPLMHTDDTDGYAAKRLFPKNAKELREKLALSIPEKICKRRPINKLRKQYYLCLHGDGEATLAFRALHQIYPDNIACDTATLLWAYAKFHKKLSLNDLYKFLNARADIQKDKPLPLTHPYHASYLKMLEKLGDVYVLDWEEEAKLEQILMKVGDQAIIEVWGHIGFVQRVSDTQYTFSDWDHDGPSVSGPYSVNEYPAYEAFANENGEFSKIIKYLKFN